MQRYLSIVFVALLAACQAEQPSEADERTQEERNTFGDEYRIVAGFNEGEPDVYPLVIGDSLIVRVTYPGGCESHTFELHHMIVRDTAFVWFFHDARGDACSYLVQDELSQRLPRPLADTPILALRHPDAVEPQVLRDRAR